MSEWAQLDLIILCQWNRTWEDAFSIMAMHWRHGSYKALKCSSIWFLWPSGMTDTFFSRVSSLCNRCLVATLWSLVRLRKVVCILDSRWWCVRLSALACHIASLCCLPVQTSSWRTYRPRIPFNVLEYYFMLLNVHKTNFYFLNPCAATFDHITALYCMHYKVCNLHMIQFISRYWLCAIRVLTI